MSPKRYSRSITPRIIAPRIIVGITIIFSVLVALVAAAFLVPAQWAGQIIPGHSVVDDEAAAVKPWFLSVTANHIDIVGAPTHEPEGEILFAAVSIDSSINVWEWFRYSNDDTVDVFPREWLFGSRTNEEERERDRVLMENSQHTATIVALEYLGYDAAIATGVYFTEIVEDSPAEDTLQIGDVVVALDNNPVTDIDSLLGLTHARSPGDTVTITVADFDTGAVRDETLTLTSHPEDNDDDDADATSAGVDDDVDAGVAAPRGFIGLSNLYERVELAPDAPQVDFSTHDVGGPSAGLAFSLSIIDLLSEGELTGGAKVAVTGTISLDGTVGTVGGVKQKTAAARDQGIDLMIVPEPQLSEAEPHAGDMTLVGVNTLEAAVTALEQTSS